MYVYDSKEVCHYPCWLIDLLLDVANLKQALH